MTTDNELLSKLELWLAARPEPPTLFEVAETGDGELLAAFILNGFRVAARQAVVDRLDREAATTFATEATRMTTAILRVFDGIARAWSLQEDEKLDLLGLHESGDLEELRTTPLHKVPTEIIERVAILLDIFKAINTLLPQPTRADAWIRATNSAPAFAGWSALDVMIHQGLGGLREVRTYLQAKVWTG